MGICQNWAVTNLLQAGGSSSYGKTETNGSV